MSRKLWLQYSLRVSLVLCLATILPIIVLYLLSEWGLVEATYDLQTGDERTDPRLSFSFLPQTHRAATDERSDYLMWPEGEVELTNSRADTNNTRLPLRFDEETGGWWIEPTSSNLVLSVPVFKLRVDVPAWIALASMPLISLLLGVAMSIWMSRRVTRPISNLSEATQAIGNRKLGVRVPPQGSQELHDLAASFNRMAADLDQAQSIRRQLRADIAHELRTPLTVLDGNLRAILDGIHPMDEKEIATLQEQTQHLSHIVEDLRELSLAEADQLPLNLEEVNLAAIINESARHFEFLADEKEIDFGVACGNDIAHPALDGHRIRQVLHNLLSNAFRHTPDGGQIILSAERAAECQAINIEVRDNGEGIPPSIIQHLFDRFYRPRTTEGDRSGTGLGLAIAKALVEAQGGQIMVESDGPGRGSTFRIILPLKANGAA